VSSIKRSRCVKHQAGQHNAAHAKPLELSLHAQGRPAGGRLQRPSSAASSTDDSRPPGSTLLGQPTEQSSSGRRGCSRARSSARPCRTIGRQDLWVNEFTIRYDEANPLNAVSIMKFRDGKVARERLYYGEPWEPPAWRAQGSSGWRRLGSILPRPPTERLPMTQVVQGDGPHLSPQAVATATALEPRWSSPAVPSTCPTWAALSP
jgi:hypothetical protein